MASMFKLLLSVCLFNKAPLLQLNVFLFPFASNVRVDGARMSERNFVNINENALQLEAMLPFMKLFGH